MTRPRCGLGISLAVLVLLSIAPPAHAEFGINVFGLSYHFDHTYEPNDFNPGLGLNWVFDRQGSAMLETDAGIYSDSWGNANVHVAIGGRVRIVSGLEIGLKVVRSYSQSLKNGVPVLAPYPFVAWRWSRVVLNSTYIPAVGNLQGDRAIGLFATVYPFGPAWEREPDPARNRTRSNHLEFVFGQGLQFEAPGDLTVAWRRMFSPRHGLRLGLRFDGGHSTGQDDFGGWGHAWYRTRILVQYLRRYRTDHRVRPWWAAGLRVATNSLGFDSGRARDAGIANFGVEVALGPTISLTADYGIEAGWLMTGGGYSEFYWVKGIDTRVQLGLVAGF